MSVAELSAETVIAVFVPCYNEEVTIAKVVQDFQVALPEASVYVYDNASTDNSAQLAQAAGAVLRRVNRPGKGNVVRQAFAELDADVVLMVDGDSTYDATRARELVQLVLAGHDHVVGARRHVNERAYPLGHEWGNRLLTGTVARLFGNDFSDMLSGYRAFSRRFIKSFPAHSAGFEIETELTVHTLGQRLAVAEIETDYFERPAGSESKLSTIRDGWRVSCTILNLLRRHRPVFFHGVIAAVFLGVALVLGIPVVLEYFRTGLVPRFPTAILASSLVIVSLLFLVLGYVLDAIAVARAETRRLAFLAQPGPWRHAGKTEGSRGGNAVNVSAATGTTRSTNCT